MTISLMEKTDFIDKYNGKENEVSAKLKSIFVFKAFDPT